ncbi:hypothetical protein OG488_06080 [Streptomyces sp. NBC_01460]|uniref:hypothetical protein n=1 Tax=Streptomyces sp. NBC_01460 TaxID=2903875 RepID=UPI002E31E9B4|nr:hypothetical protein [Streptomyces sp. NBC_01460]
MLDNVPEKAALSIESIESVTPGVPGAADAVAICVVRCVEGTARLGMVFQHPGSAASPGTATPECSLTAIEWYGRQVEQLDTVHSGKVTLTGTGAERLARRDVLNSAPQH